MEQDICVEPDIIANAEKLWLSALLRLATTDRTVPHASVGCMSRPCVRSRKAKEEEYDADDDDVEL